jgi:hypothetical protein
MAECGWGGGGDFRFTHRTSPYSKGTVLISYFDIANVGFTNHGGQAATATKFLRCGLIFVGPRYGT